MELDFSGLQEKDLIKILFSEKVGVIVQSPIDLSASFKSVGIKAIPIGQVNEKSELNIGTMHVSIPSMRKVWMSTSTKLEQKQTTEQLAHIRADNVVQQPLKFNFPQHFDGKNPK